MPSVTFIFDRQFGIWEQNNSMKAIMQLNEHPEYFTTRL